MKEFGSDFHYFESYFSKRASLCRVYKNAVYFAFGRQPVIALIRQNRWKRIWLPEYFCYDVIESITKATKIETLFYKDYPGSDDETSIKDIPFEEGDVLFRVNYFGSRGRRSNKGIPVPVIEDHSHDLLGHWSLFSDADWCIASLRKSLPIAEGGLLWSPKNYQLPDVEESSENNEQLAAERWAGMVMKADYLDGKNVEKNAFREKYLHSEDLIDTLQPCAITTRDFTYIKQFDINAWYNAKKHNWSVLQELQCLHFSILQPEGKDCTPFSLILLANSKAERDALHSHLIRNCVYPAILWQYERTECEAASDYSGRILSLHCDGRYTVDDINELMGIISSCRYE